MAATRVSLFTKLFRRTPKTIRTPKPPARTQLGLTTLEARDVPATLSGGTIYIYGTAAADTAYVSETVPAHMFEMSRIQVVENGRTQFFSKNYSTQRVYFSGGAGNDTFQNSAYLKATAYGGGGLDTLSGGPLDDAMYGEGEADAIYGNNGNDTLNGGNGADEMRGGGDNDTLYGGTNNDTMRGGPGNDTLYGQDGYDTMFGDNNNGTAGGAGADRLYGGAGNDAMYGEGGKDTVSGGPDTDSLYGGTDDDTLIAIDDGLTDSVYADAGRDTLWVDSNFWSTDNIYWQDAGLDVVHRVVSFQNGADKTLTGGDVIADPSADVDGSGNPTVSEYKSFAGRPLFADAGPTAADVDQQDRGDCWIMATAASIANQNPHQIRHTVADAGDGTYLVSLGANFYRVDADLPTQVGSNTPRNAGLGVQDSLWVAVVEKAYAHFRTGGANHSYRSLDGGNPADAARAFNLSGVDQAMYGTITVVDGMGDISTEAHSTALELRDQIQARLSAGQNVTICTDGFVPDGSPLIGNHAWAVTGIAPDGGSFTLRNPWGLDVTVSLEDMYYAGVWVTWGAA